jgi:hypothetical protein
VQFGGRCGRYEGVFLGLGRWFFGICAERTDGFGSGRGFFGLRCVPGRGESLEFLQCAVIVAFAGVDHPLEALEGGSAGSEGVGGSGGLHFGVVLEESINCGLPEIGFDDAQTAEAPFVVDESVDQKALGGIGWAVLVVKLGGEFGEVLSGFVEESLGFGVDAVLQGVEAGFGLSGRRCAVRLTFERWRDGQRIVLQ